MAGYPLIQDQRSKMNTRFSTKGGSQTLMPKILKLPPNFCPLLPPTKILRPHFIHAPPPPVPPNKLVAVYAHPICIAPLTSAGLYSIAPS